MTKFDKSKFSYYGGYLMYGNRFVARFKYAGPFTKDVFLKQLLKNHTVEEYFAKLDKLEGDYVAPLRVLQQADPKWYESELVKYKEKIENKYGFRVTSRF